MAETKKPIRKAVFPVAGLGTRFLPATKAMPKEMLTVVDRPVIQHVVDEAREAGIEHFIFITGRNKGVIEDHFDSQFELEQTLTERGKRHLGGRALVRGNSVIRTMFGWIAKGDGMSANSATVAFRCSMRRTGHWRSLAVRGWSQAGSTTRGASRSIRGATFTWRTPAITACRNWCGGERT